jgi:SAM-dependent methyltransferase
MMRRIAFLAAGAAAFAPRPHALRVRRAPRATAVAPRMVLAPAAAQVVRVGIPTVVAAVAGVLIKQRLDRPSRPYEDGSVGREYDAWTREGILEHYWGEHIHLGYYTDEELAQKWFGSQKLGFLRKDFIEAKYNFTQRMLDWGGVSGMQDAKILDVGCGIGGTTRYMADLLPNSNITGITLSPEQAKRATDLAKERNVPNANFQVMDALQMDFPVLTQRDFQPFPNFTFASTATTRRHAAATPSTRPCERLRVSRMNGDSFVIVRSHAGLVLRRGLGLRKWRTHARQGEVRPGDGARA